MSTADMEVEIELEFLRRRQNEVVVKELSVAAKNMVESFRFRSTYNMTSHGLSRSVHGLERGGGRVRSPLLLWR